MLSTLFDPFFDPFCLQLTAAFSEALWRFFWTVPRSHASMTLMTLLWRHPYVKNLGPKVGKTPAACQVESDGIGYSPNNWTWHVSTNLSINGFELQRKHCFSWAIPHFIWRPCGIWWVQSTQSLEQQNVIWNSDELHVTSRYITLRRRPQRFSENQWMTHWPKVHAIHAGEDKLVLCDGPKEWAARTIRSPDSCVWCVSIG